ncbi:MAG: hypothetical protein D6816_09165, partial [Bacteroidetes bacterium]
MNIRPLITLVFAFLLFFACNKEVSPPALTEIPVTTEASGEPNLHIADGGEVFLTWVEYLNDTTDALVWARLNEGSWTSP